MRKRKVRKSDIPDLGKISPVDHKDFADTRYFKVLLASASFNKSQNNPSGFIFTEKEIRRGIERFEKDVFFSVVTASERGYIGVKTYTNVNGVLTTRFEVVIGALYRLDEKLPNETVVLFSARELSRAFQRYRHYEGLTSPNPVRRIIEHIKGL